jgi:hypothetical protein
MENAIVFTLGAIDSNTREWFLCSHNERYYVPPHLEALSTTSRASTPATNIGCEDDDALRAWSAGEGSDAHGEQLQFTFDKPPKNPQLGWVFGSDRKTCDILIGSKQGGVSGSHFRITFDANGRLVLIDMSTLGTAVSYGPQARKEKRKNPQKRKPSRQRDRSNDFTWILFPEVYDKRIVIGEGIPSLPKATIIAISVENMEPRTESHNAKYETLKTAYLDQVHRMIPFGLNIDSHISTAGQTELPSPTRQRQRPIWIDGEDIGNGQFGAVYKVQNVSTGAVYAAKSLFRTGKSYEARWDREVAILRSISHVRIIL